MIVACVSTALPWQKGHIAGRVLPSTERGSGTVIVSSAARVEWHEVDGRENCRSPNVFSTLDYTISAG